MVIITKCVEGNMERKQQNLKKKEQADQNQPRKKKHISKGFSSDGMSGRKNTETATITGSRQGFKRK
jgi:hypothetical protein